eukprot:COSAG01_NODE_17007_length_1185_cov_1.609576_3_plen_251_part_01
MLRAKLKEGPPAFSSWAALSRPHGTVLYNRLVTLGDKLPILSFSTERNAIVGLSLDAKPSVQVITASHQEEFQSTTSNLDERLVKCLVSPLVETRPHGLESLEEPATLTFDLLQSGLRGTDLIVLHKSGPHSDWEILNEEVNVQDRRATMRVRSFCWRVLLRASAVAGIMGAAAASSVEVTAAVTSMVAASTVAPAIAASATTVGLLVAAGMARLPSWLDALEPEGIQVYKRERIRLLQSTSACRIQKVF